MKYKQNKNIVIAVLCCLMLLMGVGFAILSTQLVINGNANVTGEWDIYIESITPIEEGYSGESISAYVNENDKTKASFTADLKKPKDFVEYKVVVKNNGNIDAKLDEVIFEGTTSNEDIRFTHTSVEDEILYANDTTEFTIKVEVLESATIVETKSLSSSLKLSYVQYDTNDDYDDEGGMGVPAPASTKIMAKLNNDGTVNLSVSEYAFDESVDGIELYASDEYDGEFILIADITDGSSINVEESKFNEYYEIKSYNIENGLKVYTDYTGNVELKAPTPEIEKMFGGCSVDTNECFYAIYNINDYKYDGFALYYSADGFEFDVATNPGEGTDVYSTSSYYPQSGEIYYYKIYGYLDLNGYMIYSELSDEVTITNEN